MLKHFYFTLQFFTIGIFLCCSTEINGQNLFFLGEKSYPCTKSFKLEPDSESKMSEGSFMGDLIVKIAKDKDKGLLVLSRKTSMKQLIKGEVLVYLDDGTVIKCIERGINDYVNNEAISVYYLTTGEIEKIKSSNINTIRYSMVYRIGNQNGAKHSYTATNKPETGYDYDIGREVIVGEKTDVSQLVKDLF